MHNTGLKTVRQLSESIKKWTDRPPGRPRVTSSSWIAWPALASNVTFPTRSTWPARRTSWTWFSISTLHNSISQSEQKESIDTWNFHKFWFSCYH